jgi:hypothetical protein
VRIFLGKSLRLPVIGRAIIGASFRPRCPHCGGPLPWYLRVLGFLWLAVTLAAWIKWH